MKMIKLTQVLFFAMALTMMACKGKPKDVIAKKWKVDVEGFKKALNEEIEVLKKDKEKAALAGQYAMILPMVDGMIGKVTMEFKSDGTYSTYDGTQTKTGKWSMSEDGKKITVETDKSETLDVLELSKEKLVVSVGGAEMKMKLPFVPAS